MRILATHDLAKIYGETPAVKGLDLAVDEGEIFGLLGPNGAGKTTAISMICGVVTPSRGRVQICGHDVRTATKEAKKRIGLVPQDLALYEELSAQENLRFFASVHGLKGRDLAEAITWVLGVVGLADRRNDRVATYSGGMKRRLNLAAGILHRPRLLMLDEPTVGVDPQSRAHIFETIRELNRSHGMTVLYTSHYMEEVAALCRRIGILDHGALVALDDLSELLSRHGRGGVDITVEGRLEEVHKALASFPGISRDGSAFHLGPTDHLRPIVQAVEDAGGKIRSLETRSSNLETVFLNLTGRALRDDA